MLKQGRFRHWQELNVVALTRIRSRISAENQRIFDLFCKARDLPLLERTATFVQTGVYLQTLLGNVGLITPVAWNRI
jgi:hypothetical protein